jgi:hypothetical protein
LIKTLSGQAITNASLPSGNANKLSSNIGGGRIYPSNPDSTPAALDGYIRPPGQKGLNDNFLLVYYAGDPTFLWRLWHSYKLKYHCEKYENFLTSGFEHYHFPLNRQFLSLKGKKV